MRVIAGTLGGRKIKTISGKLTRPTLDKVKESLFNALGQFFSGGIGLDLFAGSGSLGIEAISRGIDKCIFIDKNYAAYQTIKENIQLLNIEDQSEVYKMDAFKGLQFLKGQNYQFDYVFLDPPYQKQKINEIIKILEDDRLLNEGACIITECLKEEKLLKNYKNTHYIKEYLYGITKITIYKKSGDGNE